MTDPFSTGNRTCGLEESTTPRDLTPISLSKAGGQHLLLVMMRKSFSSTMISPLSDGCDGWAKNRSLSWNEACRTLISKALTFSILEYLVGI